MIPYIILLIIPLTLQTLLKSRGISIRVSNKIITDGDNVALPVFFILFLLVLALRDETLGRDLLNYKYIFQMCGIEDSWKSLVTQSEPLFKLYNWVIYNYISENYQIYITITAIISVLPIALVYCRDRQQGYMQAAIFVNMSTFIMLFSGIRQGLAMAVGMLAYKALTEHRKIRYVVLAVISLLIHHTGFMVFFFYPLWYLRLKRRDLIWIVPSIVVIIVFNQRIFNIVSLYIGSIDDKYGATAGSTGAWGSFVLFLLFSAFVYLISDESIMNEEDFALRNILLFATVLQTFASLNPWAMRMNYYFILLIPIAVGKSIKNAQLTRLSVAKAGEIVICVFFTLLFFRNIYMSYVTSISALDTIPYIPFWKN